MDVHLVRIVLNDEHRGGVDWEAIVSDFHTLPLKKEDNPVWTDKRYRLSAGTVSSEDYAVLLDALDTVGQVSQVPQENIRLTADEPLAVTLDPGDSKTQTIRLQLRWAPSGPALNIEPYIGVLYKDAGRPPVALTLRAQTKVEVKSNMAVVLGGLTEEVEITKTRKFPLLGDLPLLGLVFRNQGHWVQKTETVIFLIPRIDQGQKHQDQ